MFELNEITTIQMDWAKVEAKFEKLLVEEIEKLTYISIEITESKSLIFCDLTYVLNKKIGKETVLVDAEIKTDLIEKVEYTYSEIKKCLNS